MRGVGTASKDSDPDHLKSVIDLETGVLFDPDTRSEDIRIRTARGSGAAGTYRLQTVVGTDLPLGLTG
jgi:hypothetical protein